jgi:hypothetical protein
MSLKVIYASFREQIDLIDYTVTVLTGDGNLTNAISGEIYIQLFNRAGRNLLSPKTTINLAAGDGIEITLNESLIQPGEELGVMGAIISFSASSLPEDAKQLARWEAKESDQITLTTLPATITLTEDEHFVTDGIVANAASLPTGDNLTHGMLRQVTETTKIYRYDSSALEGDIAGDPAGYWVEDFIGFDTFIGSTEDENGSDRSISAVTNYIPAPPKQDGVDSTPIAYWILNGLDEDSGSVILPQTLLNLRVRVNGLERAGDNYDFNVVFSNLFKIKSQGYVRRVDGSLDTSITDFGVEFNWNPNENLIIVPQQILRGYAWAIEISASFNINQLQGRVSPGDSITIDIFEIGSTGIYTAAYYLVGDAVLNALKRMRVVPTKLLPGLAFFKTFFTPVFIEKPLIGLLPDTPNQLVAVSGSLGGDVRIIQDIADLGDNEVVRAIVSTEANFSSPSPTSTPLTIAANQNIIVTLEKPILNGKGIIRADYPDVIAGNIDANWNNPSIRLYVLFDGDLYQRNSLIVSNSSTLQNITIDNLNDFTIIAATEPPTQPDLSFGLWGYNSITAVVGAAGGILAAGDYSFIWAWEYPSPNELITKIDHSEINTNVAEISKTLSDILSDVEYYGDPLPDAAAARELLVEELINQKVFMVGFSPFVYDVSSEATDDGVNAIKPNAVSTNPGRLVAFPNKVTVSDGTNSYTRDEIAVDSNDFALSDNTTSAGLALSQAVKDEVAKVSTNENNITSLQNSVGSLSNAEILMEGDLSFIVDGNKNILVW